MVEKGGKGLFIEQLLSVFYEPSTVQGGVGTKVKKTLSGPSESLQTGKAGRWKMTGPV